MKKILLLALLVTATSSHLFAQCTTANINWDNLDFLVSSGNYAGYVTDARARDQRFAFGPENMRIQVGTGITINGENATHTGEAGAFGAGEDISFNTTVITPTSITITFSAAVTNLRFSIFDIDNNQDVAFAAFNGITPVNTTLTEANTTGANIFLGPASSPSVNGTTTGYANTSDLGTVNVAVAGPVTSITLTFSTAANDFWISDFQACVPGSFPTNYYLPSQPWTGQPAYIIATSDTNLVHTINMTTGEAKQLFTETGSRYVNSLAYDQTSKYLYYTPDDVDPATIQRSLKKYDFNTETTSIVVNDVASLGIPYFENGVESGGAAYYDNCLYLGVEGGNAARTSLRESIIWRIEFDASFNPTTVSQVFGILVDNGSRTLMHDWGDFVIKDGILYNWNSRTISGNYRVHHFNLQTQVLTNYTTTFAPKQNGILWNGTIYELNGVNLRQYNGTTGLTGTALPISGPGWFGGSGDGTEAFSPKADFGDAPSGYDPALSPAMHEKDTLLRLGNTFDHEWQKTGATSFANADGADEDGLLSTPILCPCSGNFFIPVRVFNNSGANATLIAWLDYDGDGSFEASEALTATVGSSASMQTINLNWTNAWSYLPDNSFTYLRIRLTAATNGMTTSTPSGYMPDGEVEDYRVLVDGFPLAVNIVSFTAKKDANGGAMINWKVNEDAEISHYYVQKSTNGKNWNNIATKNAFNTNTTVSYQVEDPTLQGGTTYYRLQLVNKNGASRLSEVKQVSNSGKGYSKLTPNPVINKAIFQFTASANEKSDIKISNAAGTIVKTQAVFVRKGQNAFDVNTSELAAGLYTIQITTTKERVVEHFVKQ